MEGLKLYSLKENVIKGHAQGLPALLRFMEEMDIQVLNNDVVEAYRKSLLSDSIHSLNYKKEKYCTICLLSDILEGRPHSRHNIMKQEADMDNCDEMYSQITAFLATISVD